MVDILKHLINGPDGQIDISTSNRLAVLIEKDDFTSDELLAIIDDAVYGSLVSQFTLNVLNMVWEKKVEDEGSTKEMALLSRDKTLRHSQLD